MSEPVVVGILEQEVLGTIEQPSLTVAVVYQGLTINNYEGGGGGDLTIEDVDGLQDALGDLQPLSTVLTNTTASFTTAKDTKLTSVESGAQVNVVPDWNVLVNVPAVIAGTTASYTIAKDTKLAGIAPGAQVNVVPDWNNLINIPAAVSGTEVAFTSDLNTKLEGIAPGAQVNVVPDWLALTNIPAVISSTTAAFTTVKDTKLTGIEAGAQVNVAPAWGSLTGVPAVITGTTASFTTAKDTKLTGIETGAQANVTPTIASVTGLATALADKQAGLWIKAIFLWRPTGAIAGSWIGTAGSGSGTFATSLPVAAGSIYAGIKKALYSNVITTANQMLGQRNTETIFFIGNVTAKGGFFYQATFGFDTWTNGGRMFAGFSSTTNSVVVNEPSANNQSLGFAVDSTDNGAIYFMSRNATTTTRQATGLTLASSVGFDCRISCDPNGTTVNWSIKNIETGAEVTGSINTNLPTATTTLTTCVLASNAALTPVNSIQLGVGRIYVETNY